MKDERNYLAGIYDIIYAEDTKVENDGIEIIGDDEVEGEYDYEPEWGEDVEIIDEDYVEDDCYLEELGDGFIPLPQGDVEVNVIAIDENYVPDEYEADVCGGYSENEEVKTLDDESEVIDVNVEMNNYTNKEESTFDNELKRLHEASEEDSVINTPKTETLSESIGIESDDLDRDKIAKSVAKEYMERSAEQSVLPGEENIDEIETAWIDEDVFGNDIGSIITDVPEDINIEDQDYIDGSFEDWANEHGVTI